MAFTMPHPFKDKKTGIYYLRVRVPAALKRLEPRSEFVKSLRTRDPVEAKTRFAEEYAKVQKHWAALQAAPQPIPHKRIMGSDTSTLDALSEAFLEQSDKYMTEDVMAALEEAGFRHRPDGKGGLIVIDEYGTEIPFLVAVKQKIVRFV